MTTLRSTAVRLLACTAVLAGLVFVQVGSSGPQQAVASDATIRAEVRWLYQGYLGRSPDPVGAATWQEQRRRGVSTLEIGVSFTQSGEFASRHAELSDDEFVTRVYRNALGRRPDPHGAAGWGAQLAAGRSRGEVATGIVFSQESLRRQARFMVPATTTTTGRGQLQPAAPTTVAPTTVPPVTVPPTTVVPVPAPSPSPGGYGDVATNVNVNDWLMRAWEQNPSTGYPAFRMFCQFSHVAYVDPIVGPGNANFPHLHMFFGNTGVNQNSTYQSLRTSGNSTCDGGPLNRTAYWMPAVFDGQNQVVVPSRFELYYKAENAANPSQIQAKPNGLRMVAGAPDARVFGWRCGGRSGTTIPECSTGERLTVSVRFPYCWDGKNLDSPDHRSHMSYGTNNTWGPCPASHPVHLPELTEFAHFDNVSGTGSWYLSSDRMSGSSVAPNGSTMHADWFGAWDNGIQERWVDNCLRGRRNASNGNLCDGQQLSQAPAYTGPTRIPGWTPSP